MNNLLVLYEVSKSNISLKVYVLAPHIKDESSLNMHHVCRLLKEINEYVISSILSVLPMQKM